ncbi:ADP-ribosylglycohydrolase family protein [Candidatus Poribacteria bacterium]
MLPTIQLLRKQLHGMIRCMTQQGHAMDGLEEELQGIEDSYDALAEFAMRVADSPIREDWPYIEPHDLGEIWDECDPGRPTGAIAEINLDNAAERVEAAFLGAVCGCMLGKPLEANPTLEEIRKAAEATGDWPINDYISEKMLDVLGRRHGSWTTTSRDRIQFVSPDDDMNYSILGMLVLERKGIHFTRHDIMNLWLHNLAPGWAFGPERVLLIKAAMRSIGGGPDDPFEDWTRVWNPGSELCGAVIRIDAYGYACPGRPALAAELAWRDSSWTHRRTGIYGSMFVAAAIACAFVSKDPLEIFETALKFVPQRSRFYEIVADSLHEVAKASDWLDGYGRINSKYGNYRHCQVYQEVATLINSLRFADSVGHGICVQVSQGNDTDCFGELAGSLLGAYFGPGHLEERWLEPFNNEICTSLAEFHERSLSRVAQRMAALPRLVAKQLGSS